jgi:hypothetical protein
VRKIIKRLPKVAYLVWDNQANQSTSEEPDYYLLAAEKLEDHAEKGSKRIVGTYKLVAEDSVQLVTKLSQRKLRQR